MTRYEVLNQSDGGFMKDASAPWLILDQARGIVRGRYATKKAAKDAARVLNKRERGE